MMEVDGIITSGKMKNEKGGCKRNKSRLLNMNARRGIVGNALIIKSENVCFH